jgi:hypothetical protein
MADELKWAPAELHEMKIVKGPFVRADTASQCRPLNSSSETFSLIIADRNQFGWSA